MSKKRKKEKAKNRKRLIFSLILLLCCVTLVCLGYLGAKKNDKDLEQNGAFTTGIITKVYMRGTFRNRSSLGYDVNYQYKVNNITYKNSQSIGRRKNFEKGQKVKIFYSKLNPQNSRLILE